MLGAALINGLKVVKKDIDKVRVVINGAGSAGCAIAHFLLGLGVKDMIICDRDGALYDGKEGMTIPQAELAKMTNFHKESGLLADAMKGADVFIGVSAPNIVSKQMVASMNKGALVFPMANPTPEIAPDLALEAGAAVVGTGRSDFNNQINNVLAFPGIFRGALDARASQITEGMKKAASYAIASLVSDEELCPEYIMPKAFDERVGKTVAQAVKQAAIEEGVARIK